MPSHRRARKVTLAGALALSLTAPAALVAIMAPNSQATAAPEEGAKVTARFASPKKYKTHPAVTYNNKSVPKGSWVQVVEKPNNKGGIIVTLKVRGLQPNKNYGARVHTRPCGATPAAAGRQTQNSRYDDWGRLHSSYEENEVWLDFKTDRFGNATSESWKSWRLNNRQDDQAHSVVIDSNGSHAAKARVACVTVPFKITDSF
jgi:Cu-Zn family superoxide dismutase